MQPPAPNAPRSVWPQVGDATVPARYIGQRKSSNLLDFSQLALPTTESEGSEPEQVVADELGTNELPPPTSPTAPKRSGTGFDPLGALPPSMVGSPPGGARPNPAEATGKSTAAAEAAKRQKEADDKIKYSGKPSYSESIGPKLPHHIDGLMRPAPYDPSAFSAGPYLNPPTNPAAEISIYRCKHEVPTQRPWLELWRPQYTAGIYPEPLLLFGEYNPMQPAFIAFGDFRSGVGINQGADGDNFNWATQLNLNMDLRLTATERIFAFTGPLDNGRQSTRLDFTNDINFISHTDLTFDSLFFEGDVGSIVGGFNGHDSTFDLPFSVGLLPLFYQNGVWAADNVVGGAVAIPARHSKLLRWSNFDATFFFALDKVDSDAFAGDNNAAELFGTSWFIDAYDGHIEVNYAWVHDDRGQHRSYHNFGIGFTRRYFHRVSNAIRFITNFDQSLSRDQRTADGHLLLLENSLISTKPNTVVPYLNLFYGQGRTQSLARAAAAGAVLVNTGINFASDALTGYPTLDATGVNTAGGALGINILGDDFSRQLVLEAATVAALGDRQFRNAAGNQLGLGIRYQQALNNSALIRTDHMYGFLGGQKDITGSRVELRLKY